jgi:transposase
VGPVADDGEMSGSSPRAGGPSRRRSFNLSEKREHLAAYEAACEQAEGGAYLRRHGLYSSLIFEWRRLRDAGLLGGGQVETTGASGGSVSAARVGRLSPEQAEIARLRKQLAEKERRLATTETALEIMGKAHALLEQISESADTEQPRRKR